MFVLTGMLLLMQWSSSEVLAQDYRYLFAGHTYEWHTGGSKVDPRLERMNLQLYDQIWLGGDVCSEASLTLSTLQYIDSIFHLSAPGNHWALGNHDIRDGNVQWITSLTGRKTFYAYHFQGVTTMVMNTNLTPAHCEDLDDQFNMIVKVCDSISTSSHFIVLMHHAIWDGVPGLPPPGTFSHTYFPFWNANCFAKEGNTFLGQIYPLLLKVRERGIQVICLTGDMGANAKKFERVSDEGIVFLGCGLNNSYFTDPEELSQQPEDLVLIFDHHPAERKLTWEFVEINRLIR